MKLHIPEQNKPAKGAIPNHPRKLKKWLAGLPHANMGEMTRQIYSAVRELNRQTMPNRYRIEDMELLREPVRNIFNNLEKYFINRTLPLPEKSQKIVNLNQSLLKEMSYGYKIIIFEAANGLDKKVDLKTQNIAILRAIRYMSELLLRASEIYEPYPVGAWYDIHQMYAYAEQHGLHNKTIPDVEYKLNKASIADYYKQVMLFALARPSALRQSDSERLYNKLAEWADQTKLGREAREHQVNRFFCSRIDQDRPPNYLSMHDCDGTSEIRTLETSELVDTIRKDINIAQNTEGKLAVGDQLSAETLQVLAMSWGVCAKRRFSRADRRGHIKAAIGLVNAAREIAGKMKAKDEAEPEVNSPGRSNKLNISLEAIPEDLKDSESQLESSYMTHHEIGSNDPNPWDLVAKGKTLTDAYAKERQFQEDTKLGLYNKYDLHWEIVNVSAGGYCLRWTSETTSRAQVGEPIALRENEPDGSITWRIGVIRWMQFIRESGLEIGVQVLSPKVMSATVQRSNRPKEEPFECLMLPAIKALDLPTSVLLPTHAFRPGDKLKIRILEQQEKQKHKMKQNQEQVQEIEIHLDSVKEHTGSFTQFQFTPTEVVEKMKKEEKNKSSARNKDDFDEIWSSL